MSKSAIVIGAGIVGLATARALAIKGYEVIVIERSGKAVGASVRNFGMIWPIGQTTGKMYERSIRSRNIWKTIAEEAGFWFDECGSLHLAYFNDEWTVLQELNEAFNANQRSVTLINPSEIKDRFSCVNLSGLKGGLYSSTEMIIDPREAIAALPTYLQAKYKITFIWDKNVTAVEKRQVRYGNETIDADIVCICSGADFETLYPEKFAAVQLTKCKLQMMRFINMSNSFRIGTSLCSGLSLVHYESFKLAPSLGLLKKRYEHEMSEYLKKGIHVMVCQNGNGEFIVGDSHEYGSTFEPFDDAYINEQITSYLKTFMLTDNWKLIQSWHGIYPKMTNTETDIFFETDENVYIINGLGGAGMTLSFGFAEEIVATL